jgi:quercetin dioxygenase-like cupin family protein
MARRRDVSFWAAVLIAAVASAAIAAPPTVRKTTLEDQPFPASYHTTTVRTVIAPGGDVPPHTHPGLEMAYILAGRASITVAGQAPVTLTAGGSMAIDEGRVHSVHNAGRVALVIISTYVVREGEPMATPAN